MPLFETITNLADGAERLRRRPYGVIEAAEGRFRRVLLRPFPKIVSAPGAMLMGGLRHRRRPGDSIRLYYNRPRRFPNFLVLKYAESARDTSLRLARAGAQRARRDRPAHAQRRPAVRRFQPADQHPIARSLGLGAALPRMAPPALHQAVLRLLSVAEVRHAAVRDHHRTWPTGPKGSAAAPMA